MPSLRRHAITVSPQRVALEEQINGWREGWVNVRGVRLAVFLTFNLQGQTEGLAVSG